MSSNQRAIRLAISGLLIVFGLISLSQAGFYVIRYLTFDAALNPQEMIGFLLSFWRGYWSVLAAIIIHFTIKAIVNSVAWRLTLVVSFGLTLFSFIG
ncbi:MAG: hypothetical protein HRU23_14280 [Gammaproteobacteria bacterium]|nr:hypothetical protein [Gammaproteobacteria bacterium]